MLKRITLALALVNFAACGAYFVDTEPLTQHHQEDSLLLGTWSDGDINLVVRDGPDDLDRFCTEGDGDVIEGDVHILSLIHI